MPQGLDNGAWAFHPCSRYSRRFHTTQDVYNLEIHIHTHMATPWWHIHIDGSIRTITYWYSHEHVSHHSYVTCYTYWHGLDALGMFSHTHAHSHIILRVEVQAVRCHVLGESIKQSLQFRGLKPHAPGFGQPGMGILSMQFEQKAEWHQSGCGHANHKKIVPQARSHVNANKHAGHTTMA